MPEGLGQLSSPAPTKGSSAATGRQALVMEGMSAAPNPHRERQGEPLQRNSWPTFFSPLFLWPEATAVGQTAKGRTLQSSLSFF